MIYIRIDKNPEIGLGHFINMTGLGEELQIRGEAFRFLIREDDLLLDELKKSAFGFMVLPQGINDKDEPLWINENLNRNDIIIVDLIKADRGYLAKLSDKFYIMLSDNLEDPTLPSNLYFNGKNYAKKYEDMLIDERRDYLVGEEYFILRTQFSNPKKRVINEECNRLLITMGGSDSLGLTKPICDAVHMLFDEVDVVIGSNFSKVPDLSMYENVKIHNNVSDMEILMEECDLCITQGGNTIYELASVGTPTITYISREKQIEQNRVFHQKGTLYSLGDGKSFNSEKLIETVRSLKEDFERRVRMSETGQRLVDGEGAKRVVDELFKYYNLWRH